MKYVKGIFFVYNCVIPWVFYVSHMQYFINYRVTPEGNNEFAGWARMAHVSMKYMAFCVTFVFLFLANHKLCCG